MHVKELDIWMKKFIRGFSYIVSDTKRYASKADGNLQRTGVDKSAATRFWGGVGGANIKNLYTPLAPQTRRTAEC